MDIICLFKVDPVNHSTCITMHNRRMIICTFVYKITNWNENIKLNCILFNHSTFLFNHFHIWYNYFVAPFLKVIRIGDFSAQRHGWCSLNSGIPGQTRAAWIINEYTRTWSPQDSEHFLIFHWFADWLTGLAYNISPASCLSI